jgi:hypothetical protein
MRQKVGIDSTDSGDGYYRQVRPMWNENAELAKQSKFGIQ